MSRVTIKKLKQAIQRRPDDSEAWYALGRAALDAGDLPQGRHAIFQSAIAGPPDLDRMFAAAAILSSAGQHPEAERVLRRAVECFPEHPETHGELAGLLLDGNRDRDAAEVLRKALGSHRQDLSLHLLAAVVQERLGALSGAADHLATVLAADAENVEGNRRLANILGRLGDTAGAVVCWRRVVTATDSSDLYALTQLGIALSRDGQHEEAINLLSEVTELTPQNSSVYSDLGMAMLAAGQLREAAVVWSKALEVDPQSAQAYCGIGLAYHKLGKVQEAATAFRTTERLAPDNPEGPLNLGLALKALGDREGAREALLRAAALDPNDDEITAALQTVRDTPPAVDVASVNVRLSASINGDLANFRFLEVLEFLRIHKKTGALVISSPAGAATVRVVRGFVTSASAPGVKIIGEALVDRQLIDRADLDALLTKQRTEHRHNPEVLGTALLREKLGDRIQLTQVIFQQVLAALETILHWQEGGFSFRPGDEKDQPAISFDLQKVIVELSRMMDERTRETQNSAS